MDKAWPQQERFRDLVNAHRLETGCSREEVADALGVSDSSLKSLMYDRSRRPGLDLLTAASALFSVPLAELWDDPGAQSAGQDLSGMSEQRRFVARLMLEDLKAEDLSDEDVRILMEDHQRALERLRAIKGRMGK